MPAKPDSKPDPKKDGKKDAKPQVNPDLSGFDIQINEFGEITSTFDVERINDFLDRKVDDKKFRGIDVVKRRTDDGAPEPLAARPEGDDTLDASDSDAQPDAQPYPDHDTGDVR